LGIRIYYSNKYDSLCRNEGGGVAEREKASEKTKDKHHSAADRITTSGIWNLHFCPASRKTHETKIEDSTLWKNMIDYYFLLHPFHNAYRIT
jgi:hypothetical protein